MPYKIYTYEDPYKLDQTDFWDEISGLPHFCVARTLVNGLKDVLGDKIKGLICPLDDLITHEDVYQKWTDNINLRVQQYSVLTAIFKNLQETGKIDEHFAMALTQNQNHILEALRLFIELDIPGSVIDKTKGNREQKLFVHLLRHVEKLDIFQFPRTPNREKFKTIMTKIAENEVRDCRGPAKEVKRCEKAIEVTAQQPLNTIVVHGLHQFSPVQLRLLIDLEKQGLTIIFLFNYQKKYSKIYSSWFDIYSCFGAPVHHDTMVPEYTIPTMQNPSNALACALASLCEDRFSISDSQIRKWYQLYKNVQLIEFANITEYAHFVSNHFEDARKKYSESLTVLERGNNVWNHSEVLRYNDEQVYTANRDVHTLLEIYYPEYAKDRHFLSYPIGQFFAAIYQLWDYEHNEIYFDIPAIKECLNSNILSSAPAEVLLRTFYNLDILFSNITTYSEFNREIAQKYLNNYGKIAYSKNTDPTFPLRQLTIYNRYKVTRADIIALINAIREINEIAKVLFSLDSSQEDFIDFGKHFQTLEEFLKQRELTLANEQERALINALQLRLDKIKPEQSRFSGTFRDLREGLHYYLKQKNDDTPSADWIVKNFEQIDGDILQSKRQFEHEENKVYHFACLSDRDMNKTVNDQLPWPLTDEYIRSAYSPIDLQFQVYYTALGERSNFLRYALFYGLCYNRSDVRLSYVKQYGDEITEPYALFAILGLSPEAGLIRKDNASIPFSITVPQNKVTTLKYDRFHMMDMFLCPYRYFLDYVMEDSPSIQGNFLSQKYFENILVEAVWKRISNQDCSIAQKFLPRIVKQESDNIAPYFSFWKPTEIYDLNLRALHYLQHEVIEKSSTGKVNTYASTHMRIRKQFGAAKFVIDISENECKNPYTDFEDLAKRNYPKKEYSLHKLPNPSQWPATLPAAEKLRLSAKQYLNNVDSSEVSALPGDWCTYCVHRGTCMQSFLSGK